MYFPIGWPKHLSSPTEDGESIQQVIVNRERNLFAVVTTQSIQIWYCKPTVLIVTYRRSDDSVVVNGINHCAVWRADSSGIAVGTSGAHLLFFRLHHEKTQKGLYSSKQLSSSHYRRDTTETDTVPVPSLRIQYAATAQIAGGIKCLCCLRDDILVATGNGILRRVSWDGSVKTQQELCIRTIPFSVDLQQSRESTIGDTSIYITQMEYSILLGGFAAVLSDGRAAFLTMESPRQEPRKVHAVWAPEVSNACCVAINHKYRLIVFGLTNGQGIVFTVDEITGALLVSHRLSLSSCDFPDGCQAAGPVTCLRWTPDGCALALGWHNGGLSMWSVFGALLMCTLGGDFGNYSDSGRLPLQIKSMDWDPEGYHLWLTTEPNLMDVTSVFPSLNNSTPTDNKTNSSGQLLLMPFVKSALTTNPCMTNHQHLFLQGSDRLYLNTGDTILKTTNLDTTEGTSPVRQTQQPVNVIGGKSNSLSVLIGNKQWQVVQIPLNYLSANWPIRYASVDKSGHCVAVAGRYGLAHSALFAKRWKLFGNVTQERDMSVSGGMAWWRDFIVVGCYNHYENREEIRLYPRVSNLDNAFASVTKVPSQVLLVNVFKDLLIIFCADYHISLYSIERREYPTSNPSAVIHRIQDLSLANFIPHPSSLVSLTLTSLRSETVAPKSVNHIKEAESLVINVAGRLLMLQRDRSSTPIVGEPLDRRKHNEMPFCAPIVLASAVENMWTTARTDRGKPHLMEALWLGCGAAGMKVSLPIVWCQNMWTTARTDRGKPHLMEALWLGCGAAGMKVSLPIVWCQNMWTTARTDRGKPHLMEALWLGCGAAGMKVSLPIVWCQNMWTTARTDRGKPHLMEALWLGCGAAGMKVWLPLFPEGEDKSHSFLSKRIMLPFKLKIYPLAVLFEDAVVLGAATDTLCLDPFTPSPDSRTPTMPFATLERTTQIYLHHILRQLLRRNLGIHALQVARSCTNLPYFPHVLELMLHEVLEEEATASEPIPDALLPRVVAFIAEFPQYLQTVVHCARKTEIALWPYLFASVGSPQDLFEQCLQTGALKTAASYLIILQNLETPKVSRHHATQLLDTALEWCDWSLCSDLLRFLRAISPADMEAARPPLASPNAVFPSPLTPRDNMQGFKFSTSSQRSRHGSAEKRMSGGSQDRLQDAGMDKKSSRSRNNSGNDGTAEEYYIDMIVSRHARKLLGAYRLRDLALFAAHLDYKLVNWIAKERTRAAKVEDFEAALKRLHTDFQWPMPSLGRNSSSSSISSRGSVSKSSQAGGTLESQINGLKLNTSIASTPSSSNNTTPSDSTTPVVKTITPGPAGAGFHVIPSSQPGRVVSIIKGVARPQSLASESTTSEAKTQEAMLKYASTKGSDENSLENTDPSEGSSMFEDGENVFDDSFWSNGTMLEELEQMYQQLAKHGPPQSEKELRYLLQIVLEAGCLEWALLISIVLRDLPSIAHTVTAAGASDVSLETLGRMREGLSYLELWVDTECAGYKPLMLAMRPQTQILAELVETRATSPPLTPTSSISEHSTTHTDNTKRHSSHNNSSAGENDGEEDDVFSEQSNEDKEEAGCVVS
ncbi:guanine nucleotide exchange factor subunit RIC1-like [Amphiura filiformis]|uniref:guanine nucleotide exchange factor subunit RIC1-like n=1 Tax=Amphiura filiformis TaxID=82378 RepID=UPI003B20FE08